MRADRTEVFWDADKSKWQVRIVVGEEVIRRYCDLPRNADEQALRQVAQKTLADEGFDPDGTVITIAERPAA
jgi:hypothetical protein